MGLVRVRRAFRAMRRWEGAASSFSRFRVLQRRGRRGVACGRRRPGRARRSRWGWKHCRNGGKRRGEDVSENKRRARVVEGREGETNEQTVPVCRVQSAMEYQMSLAHSGEEEQKREKVSLSLSRARNATRFRRVFGGRETHQSGPARHTSTPPLCTW